VYRVTGRVGSVLLAAGGSERLGHPKQLVRIHGQTLLRRAAEAAVQSNASPVVVVLGSSIEQMVPELADLPVSICENTRWNDGMGSSIAAGVEALLRAEPTVDGLVLMVCDQPMMGVETINWLIHAWTAPDEIVASAYEGTVGVPALFGSGYFDRLRRLSGKTGARQILLEPGAMIKQVPFEGGSLDIDTPEDLRRSTESAGVIPAGSSILPDAL
jgi:molybdenum cofactor cytidylyltransferase